MSELYNHGIQNEDSDIRIHVSVLGKTVYVFQTKYWESSISSSGCDKRYASQPNTSGPTALGYLVRLTSIEDVRKIVLDGSEWEQMWELCPAERDLKYKGQFAVCVVKQLLKKGMIPIWYTSADEVSDKNIQMKGTDIILVGDKKIQVKCDYKAGEGNGCTGNLFFQTAERNPNKIH